MILLYLKQALNLLKQEKLFSSIYILGTGLSIMVVMVLSIVFYVKIANIYPELNRSRVLCVKNAAEFYENGGMSASQLAYSTVEKCFYSLKTAEAVTGIHNTFDANYVQPVGSKEQLPVKVKFIDTSFWTVFPFRFIDGKPFTEADMQSGIHTAVISESLAKRVFRRTDVTGEYISLDFRNYRVSGVVKDVSSVTETTYAQLWVPYTVDPDYDWAFGRNQTLGSFYAFMLAPSASELEKVRQEALDNIHRFDQSLEGLVFSVYGQPDNQWQSVLRIRGIKDFKFSWILIFYGVIFFILLLIPAVSLSGMTESRMERRLAETGIRRAFGARTTNLLNQILTENFLFTLLGGIVGLLFSYLFVLINSQWVLQLVGGGRYADIATDVIFTPAMLINLPVFCIALIICFVLNLLSAFIPAWRASRREIIYSLTSNS